MVSAYEDSSSEGAPPSEETNEVSVYVRRSVAKCDDGIGDGRPEDALGRQPSGSSL